MCLHGISMSGRLVLTLSSLVEQSSSTSNSEVECVAILNKSSAGLHSGVQGAVILQLIMV